MDTVVGTNGRSGSTSFIGTLADVHGNNLSWASHSHPGSGGAPSYDLRIDGKRCGDLNSAYNRGLRTQYEVYDVPNRLIYFYNTNTLYNRDGNGKVKFDIMKLNDYRIKNGL